MLLEEGELVAPGKPELGEAMDEQDQRPAKLCRSHSQKQTKYVEYKLLAPDIFSKAIFFY